MKKLTEDEIIEQLDKQQQLVDWLSKANEILFTGIRNYLPQVFVSNDPDIYEYAVKPLLAKPGPLDDMVVSLRLLYALGKIKKTIYADISCIEQFGSYVQTENKKLSFHDEMTYDFISNLNAITENKQLFGAIEKMKFSSFEVFNVERYGNIVKTGLTLAVTSILRELTDESDVES